MHKILVAGAGDIGSSDCGTARQHRRLSGHCGRPVTGRLSSDPAAHRLDTLELSVTDPERLQAAMKGRFAVISAAPYSVTAVIAEAAHRAGIHYLDLTEDVRTTQTVEGVGAHGDPRPDPANVVSLPASFPSSGWIWRGALKTLDTLRLRVGALPQFPSNALGYRPDLEHVQGVINECCPALRGDRPRSSGGRATLEELEHSR
jgi:hypothetical protein